MTKFDYDMVVIGSGPAGQRAAIQAAKAGKKVAIVEKNTCVGGVCTNSGTIPSKSFREAVLYLTGFKQRSMYGSAYRLKSRISMQDLTFRISNIVKHENQVIEDQLKRNNVDIISGTASFIDKHTLSISKEDSITSDKVVIAVGTYPYHPDGFEVDGKDILDSDQVLNMSELPRSLTVVGAGIIGLEYASWFCALGLEVTLVDAKPNMLSFVDREIVEGLKYHLRDMGMTFRLGEKVSSVKARKDSSVETFLESGKKIVSDAVLVSAGRQGAIDKLNLEAINLEPIKYGRIKVDENFKTSIDNIYAVGDVVGFPALASTGMRQGRLASEHAFNIKDDKVDAPLPFGIWTIPEISLVGETEASLTEKSVPYEFGIAKYKEIARGQLIGDEKGVLKILFHRETHEILGIHIIGEGAIEILHLGQAVLALKGGLEYLYSCVYNYPTLTECYKVAALDGLNKIRSL